MGRGGDVAGATAVGRPFDLIGQPHRSVQVMARAGTTLAR
jgi:hypothetical protein